MRASRQPKGESTFLRPYRIAALCLLVLGVLCVLVQLQSPSMILWTGDAVRGTDDGGIIYYTVNGDERTLNDPHEAPPHPVPVTVYADPDDSSHDRVSGPAKWFDAVFVSLPFAAAGVVLAVGIARRRRFYARISAGEQARREQATADWIRRREAGPPPSGSSPSR